MLINADLTQRAVVDTNTLSWVPSPIVGVERKLLEREGDEIARATSLVRYAPGSSYAPHEHGKGEEFLVLRGTFSDEFGDYPVGTYVRNPPGSRHRPFSRTGCTLLVKSRWMANDDHERVVIDTNDVQWQEYPRTPGLRMTVLHDHGRERVQLLRWGAGVSYPLHKHAGGEEVFVLDGSLSDEYGTYGAGTWVRNPVGSSHAPHSKAGALLLVKTGHLRDA